MNAPSINAITKKDIKNLFSNEKLFTIFLNKNKNFIDKIIASIIKNSDYYNYYDDLWQTGCIGLLKAMKSFNEKYNNLFSTYAWNVIRNEILQEIKKINKVRAHEVSIENFVRTTENNTQEYNETIFKSNRQTDHTNDIILNVTHNQCVEKLTPLEQTIVTMKYQGYTVREIAEKLNKNIHTVKAIYFYARQKNRKRLEKTL